MKTHACSFLHYQSSINNSNSAIQSFDKKKMSVYSNKMGCQRDIPSYILIHGSQARQHWCESNQLKMCQVHCIAFFLFICSLFFIAVSVSVFNFFFSSFLSYCKLDYFFFTHSHESLNVVTLRWSVIVALKGEITNNKQSKKKKEKNGYPL